MLVTEGAIVRRRDISLEHLSGVRKKLLEGVALERT